MLEAIRTVQFHNLDGDKFALTVTIKKRDPEL